MNTENPIKETVFKERRTYYRKDGSMGTRLIVRFEAEPHAHNCSQCGESFPCIDHNCVIAGATYCQLKKCDMCKMALIVNDRYSIKATGWQELG